jgi:hypothetical protein
MGFGTKNVSLLGTGVDAGEFFVVSAKQSVDKILFGIDYRFTMSR